jgi:hypothetical protein
MSSSITRAFADGGTQLDALTNVRQLLLEKSADPDEWGWEFAIVPSPASVSLFALRVTEWRATAEWTR